ncbi:acyltransferase family protein [Pseudoxanthomonas japonensis]|uniref:acyltransferase family protein n=1 Tax=Pseudoxanthomonas japonensis TaxID=69284 RepID=UPI0037480827
MVSQENKSPPAGMINNIQAMRGIASLVVFVGHGLLLMHGIGLDQYFSFFGVIASSGVDIFFVISGFIITTVAMKSGEEDASRLRCAWNFGVKRVVRIYPIYWLVFACAFLLTPWVNFAPPVTDIKPLAQQFLLLTHVNSYIMAAWSLAFEVYFYAVVVLALVISPRHVGKILGAWAVGVTGIIAYDYFVGQRGWIGLLPFSPLILEFIMGMAVAWLIRLGVTAFAMTAAFVGVVSFLAGLEIMRDLGWSTLNPWYRTFYNGLPSAFIIYAVVALEQRKVWVFSGGWVKLGDASYSLYIWHQFIFYSILTLLSGRGWVAGVPPLLLVCLWLVPAFVFGFFSYRHIELPIQRWLNQALLVRSEGSHGVWSGRRTSVFASAVALIAAICMYTALERKRTAEIAQSAAAVGRSIEASKGVSAGQPFDLARSAASANLKMDSALRGHFDSAFSQDNAYGEPGRIRVHGWAADVSPDARSVRMLVFYCGKYLGVAPLGQRRPDVADSLKIKNMESGFLANIAFQDKCSAGMLDGLILADEGSFAVVSAPVTR